MADTDATSSRARPPHTMRIEISLRSVLGIIAVVGSLWLLARLWQIVLMLVIALVLAGTFSPLVDWLEKHRVKRVVALGILLLALLGAVIGLGFLVIPALVSQLRDAIANAPALQRRLADFMAGFPLLAGYAETVRGARPEQYLAPVGKYALGYAQAAVEIVAYGVTTVVLAFYLIAERERVQGFFFALIPRAYHLRIARILLELETIVGGYVRGQALTSILICLYIFVLLLILGVPNPLALAVFAAFTDLIPFIGGIIALTPAVLAALTQGPVVALITFVAIVLYQEFESRVLIPRVYGLTMRLSAVAVLVALLVGGKLLGIVGALLALPIAAGIRVAVAELRIDLPGEQPGEEPLRELEDRSEAVFLQQADGVSARESAAIATDLATEIRAREETLTGQGTTPVEEQDDERPIPMPEPTSLPPVKTGG